MGWSGTILGSGTRSRFVYERWRVAHVFLLVPAQQYVGQYLSISVEFPPRQRAGSFGIDPVLESVKSGVQGGPD